MGRSSAGTSTKKHGTAKDTTHCLIDNSAMRLLRRFQTSSVTFTDERALECDPDEVQHASELREDDGLAARQLVALKSLQMHTGNSEAQRRHREHIHRPSG
jgi:hypothetical protein